MAKKVTKKKVTKKKTSKSVAKQKRGRPTDYDPVKYPGMAKSHCLLGADDKRLADLFGVTEKTINNWKKIYPEFLQSIKDGKENANAKVAESLYGRAIGAKVPEIRHFVLKSGSRGNFSERIEEVETVKHYPPDVGAAFIFLKNREPDLWRDKREVESTVHGNVNFVAPDQFEGAEEWANQQNPDPE